MRRAGVIVAVLVGVLAGLGAATAHYAEATSYLSTDPRACANCHIMQSQYDSWQKASHHTVASCVDCHLPAGFAEKWWAKTENGWNHSSAFTLQNFPEPIRITEKNAAILEDNCLRCHAELVGFLQGASGERTRCVKCHDDVGHGERAGLGGPFRDRPELEMEHR